MTRARAFLLLATGGGVACIACGGRAASTSVSPSDEGPGAGDSGFSALHDGSALLHDGVLFQGSYGVLPAVFTTQCLPGTVLPLGSDGLPNCFVVLARIPYDGGAPGDLAACRECAEPGLTPFVPSVALEDLGQGLSDYQCLCTVRALPTGSQCPPTDWTTNSWCYTGTPGSENLTPCRANGAIGFASVTAGTVFVACFPPGASP
jgi:hypothetical protein